MFSERGKVRALSYKHSPALFREDHEIFRHAFRRFLNKEAEPFIDQWLDAGEAPRSFWRSAGDQGFLAIGIPEDYGGPGGDFLHRVVVAEELGYSLVGASMAQALISDGVSEIVFHSASEALNRKWMPKLASGEARFGFAMTEAEAGSDVARIGTVAMKEGEDYVINGAKTYIGNALSADAFLVACKTDPDAGMRGISMILVEADRPGFKRGRELRQMGSHLVGTGEFTMTNVRVPRSNLVGAEGAGMSVASKGLNLDRFIWPTIAHAASQRAFDETVAFTTNRKGFGQSIIDFQNTRFRLAEMKTELAVGRAFLDDLIRDFNNTGDLDGVRCAMAKMWLPEMEARIIDQAVQLHGGAGYMDEYPVSRLYTAARLHRIFAGTSEIMRLIVGRSIN